MVRINSDGWFDKDIIAIDGLRGTGKTTLVKRLNETFVNLIPFSFPSKILKDPSRIENVNWKDIMSIIDYNQAFVSDFITKQHIFRSTNDKAPIILDRYILSNLAHFRFDMTENGFEEQWEYVSKFLYSLYNSDLIRKPDLQVYLHGHSYQPENKFDDHKYRHNDAAEKLKYCYEIEIDNLSKYCGVKTIFVSSFQTGDGTFNQVKELMKSRQLVNV